MSTHRITLVGVSGSGKSTWLGAFFDALTLGDCHRFEMASEQPTDRSALQQLVGPLQDGRYALRTPDQGAFPSVRLRATGAWSPIEEFTLEAADYPGEQLERNFDREDRAWNSEWDRRAEADSFVLILRPNDVAPLPEIPPPTAAELEGIRVLFGPSGPEDIAGDEILAPGDVAPLLHDPDVARPGAPQHIAPTLLILVEILQMIRARRDWGIGERPEGVRLAVVLTAWDAIDRCERETGPEAYLRDHYPLLHDFVWSNFDPDRIRCFGLSATGGDLDDAEYRDRYVNREEPLSQVCWSTSGDVAHSDDDVSLPFAWALVGDVALES